MHKQIKAIENFRQNKSTAANRQFGASGRKCGGQRTVNLGVSRFEKALPRPTSRKLYKWTPTESVR